MEVLKGTGKQTMAVITVRTKEIWNCDEGCCFQCQGLKRSGPHREDKMTNWGWYHYVAVCWWLDESNDW